VIEWQPAFERPPPGTEAQPETAGLFYWTWRYNAAMRTQLLVLCLAALSASAQPPNPQQTAEGSKRQISENKHPGADIKNAPAKKAGIPETVTTKGQLNKPDGDTRSCGYQGERESGTGPTWWMIALTGCLVIVSGLQALILRRQASTMSRQTEIIGSSLRVAQGSLTELQKYVCLTDSLATSTKQTAEAARASAKAAEDATNAAGESNMLTKESNATTKEATELTRRSLVLTHRPKIRVRSVVVTQPTRDARFNVRKVGEYPFGSEAVAGKVTIVNRGGQTAVMRGSFCGVYNGGRPEGLPMEPPYERTNGGAFEDLPQQLQPGEAVTLEFSGNGPSANQIAAHYAGKRKGGQSAATPERDQIGTYLLGWIRYADEEGTVRTTAFCRHYDEAWDKFGRIGDPDYEYAD
jgi:hypothetical protein